MLTILKIQAIQKSTKKREINLKLYHPGRTIALYAHIQRERWMDG